MDDKLYHGACFYPELWDEKTITEDIELVKKTGLNVVRMGEFGWSKMEPEEGRIDVSFFVDMISRLYENDIETVLCTPTPTPPIWMTHDHPERLFRTKQGETMHHGSRQHVCTNNAYFRTKAAQITEALAKAAGNHPGLVAWQLDNEFKCHVSECMCDSCRTLWHEWLQLRYGTIEQLNHDWGTHIWSEQYASFQQVPVPGDATPFLHHASLQTLYQQFSAEKIAEFAAEQAAVIRRFSDVPITHNSTLFFSVDNEQLSEPLDFASFDTYAPQSRYEAYLLNCDVWRGLKKNTPYWVMETSPSYAASLESTSYPHRDGYLQAEAAAAYALGGTGFCYWLWRQQRTGSEIPHSAVLSAWGKPGIGYQNVLGVSDVRNTLEPLMLQSVPKQAEIAITYSDKARMFHQSEPIDGIHYKDWMTRLYSAFVHEGLHRDVLPEGADIAGYKLLFTPLMPCVSEAYFKQAAAFVENGGTWIIGPITGGRTKHHTVHVHAALGDVEQWSGIETLFTFPVEPSSSTGSAFGMEAPLQSWSAVFDGGMSKGTITSGAAAGHSFLMEQKKGKGKVVMLGSMPAGEDGSRLLQAIMRHYAEEAGVTVCFDVTPGTIVIPRTCEDGSGCWVVVNMDGNGGFVTVPGYGRIHVKPHEWRVCEETKERAQTR